VLYGDGQERVNIYILTTVQEEAIKFQNENLAAAVSSHSRNLSRAVSRTVSRVPSRQVSRAVSRMGSRSSSMNSLYNLGKNEI
jgi:hypothetical protein